MCDSKMFAYPLTPVVVSVLSGFAYAGSKLTQQQKNKTVDEYFRLRETVDKGIRVLTFDNL